MEDSYHVISNRAGRVSLWLLGLVLAVTSAGPASALTPNGPHPEPEPQREVLLNGLPIVMQALPGDRVAVVCAVRAGAMFDPADRSGLAHLTGALLMDGAGSYTGERIQAELEDAGATLAVATDWDATWISAEAPAARLSVLLDVISLMVTAPRFNPADVEARKSEAIEQAKAAAGEVNAVADLALARALYGRHTYGRTVLGTPESIAAITPGDLKVFYQKFYLANGAALAVAGRVAFDEVLKLARPRFGRWEKGRLVPATFLPPTPAQATRVFVVDQPGLAGQALVRVGLLAPGRGAGFVPATFDVAAELQQDLARNLPAAQGVAARYDLRALNSPFSVSLRVPADELPRALKVVSDTMAAFEADALVRPANGAVAPGPPHASAARSLAAAEFFGAQKLAVAGAGKPLAAPAVGDAARSVLRPNALTVVVLASAAEVIEKLKAQGYNVETLTGQ
jgi:predicted Zn-dependent peptidase